MLKRLRWLKLCLAYRYEWSIIQASKRKIRKLVMYGEPLSSAKLVQLSGVVDHHGLIAYRLEKTLAARLSDF